VSLAIIIINFRTPQLTIDCLASLAPQINDVPNTRVILIDNDSRDGSIPKLRQAIEANGWATWIIFIESPVNRGFAGGNNLGISKSGDARFILLLNSDTIAQPNILKFSFEKIKAEEKIGVMSCRLLNLDLTVQNTARKFPSPPRMAAYSLGLPWIFPKLFGWADIQDPGWDRKTESRDVDWVGGAFMMIRRKAIDMIGGLDEGFFFYGEDAEFCHRAKKAGWRVRYESGASVIHLAGASSDPQKLAQREKNILTWQARYLLQRRCYGFGAEISLRLIDIFAAGLRYIKLLATGRKSTDEFARQRGQLAILLRWPVAKG